MAKVSNPVWPKGSKQSGLSIRGGTLRFVFFGTLRFADYTRRPTLTITH